MVDVDDLHLLNALREITTNKLEKTCYCLIAVPLFGSFLSARGILSMQLFNLYVYYYNKTLIVNNVSLDYSIVV